MMAFTIQCIPSQSWRAKPLACARRENATPGDSVPSPAPKRKPGRPRGSRNKKRPTRSANIPVSTDEAGPTQVPSADAQIAGINGENNGYETSFAENFHHLLPLLSKEGRSDDDDSEETRALRDLLDSIINRELSVYRRVAQDANLRPFSTRAAATLTCKTCEGRGETRCRYCDGAGFIELPSDGSF
eukprot:IDg7110t1